jgi:hypothetical protein
MNNIPMRHSILVFALMLGGCSMVTQKQGAALLEASQRYARASLDMTKEQLVQVVGPPQKQDAHHFFWDVRYSRQNFESLSVEFNSENQVVKIKGRHGRFCWGDVAGDELWVDHWNKVQTLGYPVTSSWEIPSPLIPVENDLLSNQAHELSLAIGRCVSSFYRRTGHWPSSVEEIKGENPWPELLRHIPYYHSIRFTPESDGSLTVNMTKESDSRKLIIRPPKTKDGH